LPGILERARPGDAVLMLDVDHFRSINTTRGHGGGDDVLRTFAAAIREVVHSWDSVVRYGGEEVLLLLSGTITSGEMDSLLRRIRELWRQREPGLTFSAGGVLIRPGQPAVDALAEADRLLYEAKEAGRDCWRLRGHRTESAPPTPESAASIPAQASAPEADRFPTAR
jgi:diguanylate cyclase (GGDEF)-like protein